MHDASSVMQLCRQWSPGVYGWRGGGGDVRLPQVAAHKWFVAGVLACPCPAAGKVPSSFFLADSILLLHRRTGGRLLSIIPKGVESHARTLQLRALDEGQKLKALLQLLRKRWRQTGGARLRVVAELKSLMTTEFPDKVGPNGDREEGGEEERPKELPHAACMT